MRNELQPIPYPWGAMNRYSWHVQYSRTAAQRQKMSALDLPGSQASIGVRAAIGGTIALADVRDIGTTTVCKIHRNGKPVAMREAKVVTWPQLFLLGGLHEFTAQEIFTTGWLCERIMSGRVRPWKSDASKAASLMARRHSLREVHSKGAGKKGAGKKGAGKGKHWFAKGWNWFTKGWNSY